jgi:glycosyltransferase involved in cell wall biosynthesis
MPAAFAIAEVTIIASTSPETFGRTSIEAQAMGCPVIATDIGAVPETVIPAGPGEHGCTGWVVPCGDAPATAECIAQVLALSPKERAALGSRASSHVAQKFTLDAMQRLTLSVYDELLGSNLAQSLVPEPAV